MRESIDIERRTARALPSRVAMAILLGLALCQGGRPAAAEVFTAKHLFRIQSVRSVEISPDGDHIAYLKSVPRDPYKQRGKHEPEFEDGSPWTELHVLRVADSVSMPFVTGEQSVGAIAWMPDGSGISFLAKRGKDEHKCLYVVPLHGGEARRVLAHETAIGAYDWSPDGKRVSFTAKEKEPKNKKKLKKQGFKAEIYEEEQRFTRAWIAEIGDDAAEARVLELDGNVSEFHWNPEGTHLAMALSPTPLIDDHYMKRKLQVVDVDSGEIVARIDNPGKLGQVAWSPDGTNIALISAEDLNDPAAGRLMIASATGGGLRDVVPDYLGHVSSIAWQDATTLMYLGGEGCDTVFGKVKLDGSGRKTIVPAGGPTLARLSMSRNGQSSAFLGSSPSHSGEVYYMKHGDSVPRRLTDTNPWFADMRLAKQEIVNYKARDGLDLQGVLIRPLDEEPGKRYPLILSVHGGPESHESNGWKTAYSRPGQIAAARGFAVFYPNYRGSTGRGVEFSKKDQADIAGAEFDDLVDAAKHLVKIGLVDEKRVGVTGGSYGGFASAWCATALSEHFAASVMFVGISEHISKFGTTDISNELFLVHFRRWPWDHWDWFRERSPIFHSQKARTPILILHGKDDTRVHPSQSMQLYRYLKTLGKVPVRLVFYPGEGHGNRKAAARLDYNLRMIRWMEHYLKGAGGEPPNLELDYDLPKKEEDEKEDVAA